MRYFIQVLGAFALYLVFMFEGVASNCSIKNFSNFKDIVKRNHPQIQTNQALSSVLEKTIDIAKERPNPLMMARGFKGKDIDGNNKRANIVAMHVVELGDKRDSRVTYSKKVYEKVKLQFEGNNEDLLIQASLKFFRLTQVYQLIPLYQEAQKTLSAILKIKKNRSNLSPEERVEKETLSLLINDYSLKESRLETEKRNLMRHLFLYMGNECEINPNAFSDYQKMVTFPEIKYEKINGENYSKFLEAKKNLEVAQADLELEKSKSFPNLKIGPGYAIERVNGVNYQSVGIAINMELPILNLNKSGRLKGAKEIESASLKLRNFKQEMALDIEGWKEKYQTLKTNLKSITSQKELEKQHSRIESLFRRGMISTSMVIESHRQLIEYSHTRFEFELEAKEAQLNLNKINGELLGGEG